MTRSEARRPDGPLEAVLFDFDGTLADSIPHIRASFRHAVKEVLDREIPDEVLLRNVGMPLPTQMRILAGDEDVAERLLQAYRAYNHATHDEMVRAFPGAHEVLDAVRLAGARVGLVTSKSRPIAERGVRLLGMEDAFDVIVTADDVKRHKPDPEPVVHALAALGVSPSRAAYVGDSPADVASARAAGALAVAATWGVAPRERLEEARPDVVVESLLEVPVALGLSRPGASSRTVIG
ncbi:MAG: HAD-IA family hydrolase [Coriobacteriia bacterium]|nr:HAD-IA family hydrolase [Coriobacteriia bacterium]